MSEFLKALGLGLILAGAGLVFLALTFVGLSQRWGRVVVGVVGVALIITGLVYTIKTPKNDHPETGTVHVVPNDQRIHITSPADGIESGERVMVDGLVANPNAEVWVVVHPNDVSNYWVQPKVSVNTDGKWRAQVYLGKPGNADVGKRFEIRAIASPKVHLSEGDVSTGWPDAEAHSEIVTAIRK